MAESARSSSQPGGGLSSAGSPESVHRQRAGRGRVVPEPTRYPRPPSALPARPRPLTPATPGTSSPEPLWRHLLGQRLRAARLDRGETLAETARRAGISPQYLSEIERGRKEPSSELIAAVAGALDTTLLGLTEQVADVLRGQRGAATHRTFTARACACAPRGPAFTPLAPALAA